MARLIDVATRTQIGSPLVGESDNDGAAFSESGTVLQAYESGALYTWNVSARALAAQACSVAGRNFTRSEWSQYLGNRPYSAVCPGFAPS